MCGRYTVIRGEDIIKVVKNITVKENVRWIPRYNVAPTQQVPVIAGSELQTMRWGLIPQWANDEKIGYSMINARAETLTEKPSYKRLVASRRCLIPADGFYEWRKEADDKTKTPMYIRMRDGGIFAFAGLWETWRNPTGEEVRSCTIITTTPNEVVKPIHDRMPAILPRGAYAPWLASDVTDPAKVLPLLRPYPADDMEAYPVSRAVNTPKNDVPELIARVT